MLQQILNSRKREVQQFVDKIIISSDNDDFSQFINQYQDQIASRILITQKQNSFVAAFNEIQSAQKDQETIQLKSEVERLTKLKQEQDEEITKKDELILNQQETLEQRLKTIQQLENELMLQNLEVQKLNEASIKQAKDIKDLHDSRDKLTEDLSKIKVDYNRLLETQLKDKMQMADQLNAINELQESVHQQQRMIQEENQRLTQRYKSLEKEGIYQPLAPVASEALISRSIVVDIPQMVVRKLVKHHSAEIYDLVQNLNGTLIATCGGDRIIKIYDPLNLQNVSQYHAPGDQVYTTLAFSPSYECILAGSTDNTASLLQIQGWKGKARLVGHSDQVVCVDFLGGEKDVCVTGSKDRQIKFWNINNGQCVKSIASGSKVCALKSQHNVPLIISAHYDGSLRGYSMKQESKPIFNVSKIFDDSITSITMSNDSHSVLLCSKEGYTVNLFDLRNHKVMQSFSDDKYMNSFDHNKACFGPDEKFIVAGNADSSIICWKDNGKQHKHLTKGQHEGVVLCVDYHPVSNQMYSADSRGNLVIWR